MLSMRMAKSFTYAIVVHVVLEVLKWQPSEPTFNHLNRGSRNMMNIYGFSVSLWILPLLMYMGGVVPK